MEFIQRNIPKAKVFPSNTTLELVCPSTKIDISYETRLRLRFQSANRVLDVSYAFLIVPGLFVDVLLGSPFFADKAFHSMTKQTVILKGKRTINAKRSRREETPLKYLVEIPIMHIDMSTDIISTARDRNGEVVDLINKTLGKGSLKLDNDHRGEPPYVELLANHGRIVEHYDNKQNNVNGAYEIRCDGDRRSTEQEIICNNSNNPVRLVNDPSAKDTNDEYGSQESQIQVLECQDNFADENKTRIINETKKMESTRYLSIMTLMVEIDTDCGKITNPMKDLKYPSIIT